MIIITSINWSELQRAAGEAGFDPVPAGTYDTIVDTANVKPASSGKQMIACRFKIESGPHAGSSVFNQFVLSPENANALAFFFRHMGAMGLSEAYFKSNPPLERVAADLAGRRCRIQVSLREWQGTMRNQVDAVAPPTGGPNAAPATGPGPDISAVPGGLDHFAAPPVTPDATYAAATGALPGAPPVPGVPSVPTVPTVAAPAAPASPSSSPPPPYDGDLPF